MADTVSGSRDTKLNYLLLLPLRIFYSSANYYFLYNCTDQSLRVIYILFILNKLEIKFIHTIRTPVFLDNLFLCTVHPLVQISKEK